MAGINKIPVLLGVATYYALHRPLAMAVFAAAWTGILMDSIGGGLTVISSWILVLMALLVAAVKDVAPEGSVATATLLGAIMAPIIYICQLVALVQSGAITMPNWTYFTTHLLLLFPTGAAVSALVAFAGLRIDLLAGNIKPPKEIEKHGQ